jgi:mannose-6-phosphate isomerase-like protein (cupin superfamily)
MVDVMRPILRNAKNRVNISLLIGMAIGVVIGLVMSCIQRSTAHDFQQGAKFGVFKTLAETPVRNTVHVDEVGRPITKQQLLEPFVIPNCVGFSVATFLPGQVMLPQHEHESMHVSSFSIISVCVCLYCQEDINDLHLYHDYVLTRKELFYVVEGTGFFKIEDKEIKVAPGTFLHIAPKEAHGVWVPKESEGPLKMIVTGVTVGQK